MKNFRVNVSVVNSKNVMMNKVVNFTTSVNASEEQLRESVKLFVKPNYKTEVHSGFKKAGKNTPVSFEEMLNIVKEHRFHETIECVKVKSLKTKDTLFKLELPCTLHVKKIWISKDAWWGNPYTFFELETDNTLTNPNFKGFQEFFEKIGITLYKSKTPKVWYIKGEYDISTTFAVLRLEEYRTKMFEEKYEQTVEL